MQMIKLFRYGPGPLSCHLSRRLQWVHQNWKLEKRCMVWWISISTEERRWSGVKIISTLIPNSQGLSATAWELLLMWVSLCSQFTILQWPRPAWWCTMTQRRNLMSWPVYFISLPHVTWSEFSKASLWGGKIGNSELHVHMTTVIYRKDAVARPTSHLVGSTPWTTFDSKGSAHWVCIVSLIKWSLNVFIIQTLVYILDSLVYDWIQNTGWNPGSAFTYSNWVKWHWLVPGCTDDD